MLCSTGDCAHHGPPQPSLIWSFSVDTEFPGPGTRQKGQWSKAELRKEGAGPAPWRQAEKKADWKGLR